jgi:pantetheine-phosphate adenylyltransferase
VRRPRLAVLGGTFDHLHVGHHALLTTAFRSGEMVAVGITTDRFLREHPKPLAGRIQSYPARRAALVRWLRAHYPSREWRVTPLEDPFGGSVGPGVGVLVVSGDTQRGGRAVNRERRRLGRPPVPVVVVPLVLADDLEPVSSRRIRAGEVATDGRRLTPMRVALATGDSRDRGAVERAVLTVFPQARITWEPVAESSPSRSSSTLSGRPLRPRPAYELAVRVSRRRAGGWSVVERSTRVRLRPRPIRGSRPTDLERGLVTLLRPRP